MSFEQIQRHLPKPNYHVQINFEYWAPLQAASNICDVDPEVFVEGHSNAFDLTDLYGDSRDNPSPLLRTLIAINEAITNGQLTAFAEHRTHAPSERNTIEPLQLGDESSFRLLRPRDVLVWACSRYILPDPWLKLYPELAKGGEKKLLTRAEAATRLQTELEKIVDEFAYKSAQNLITKGIKNNQLNPTAKSGPAITELELSVYILERMTISRNRDMELSERKTRVTQSSSSIKELQEPKFR